MGVLFGCGQGVVFVPEIDSGKLAPMQNPISMNTTSTNPIEPTLPMTSQVILELPGGRTLLVRALLDPVACISLVTKRVVQSLQLKKDWHNVTITGAQGISTGSSSHSTTFLVRPVQNN